MKRKKYSSPEVTLGKKETMVRERGASRYARQKYRKSLPRIGISLAEAKKRLSRPVKRSEKDIKWALGIVGIGEGPAGISENMRVYFQWDLHQATVDSQS